MFQGIFKVSTLNVLGNRTQNGIRSVRLLSAVGKTSWFQKIPPNSVSGLFNQLHCIFFLSLSGGFPIGSIHPPDMRTCGHGGHVDEFISSMCSALLAQCH
jgi:hypothetical protein